MIKDNTPVDGDYTKFIEGREQRMKENNEVELEECKGCEEMMSWEALNEDGLCEYCEDNEEDAEEEDR